MHGNEPARFDDLPPTVHRDIRRIFDYWRAIRPAPDLLPGRRNFDPMDVPDLLPSICLLDVVREGATMRFRYRLQGTRVDAMLGRDTLGRWVEEVEPGFFGSATEATYRRIADEGKPDWRRGRPMMRYIQPFAELERLFLPLASDGVMPDMILTLTIFYNEDGGHFRIRGT